MNDTTTLPANFRHVRLLLAREKAHPGGARDEGYDLLLPFDNEGCLDPHEWKTHRRAHSTPVLDASARSPRLSARPLLVRSSPWECVARSSVGAVDLATIPVPARHAECPE